MACVKRQNVSQIGFSALKTLEVMVLSQILTVNLTKNYFFSCWHVELLEMCSEGWEELVNLFSAIELGLPLYPANFWAVPTHKVTAVVKSTGFICSDRTFPCWDGTIVDVFGTFGIHRIWIWKGNSSQCRVWGVLSCVLVVLWPKLGSSKPPVRVSMLVVTEAILSSWGTYWAE